MKYWGKLEEIVQNFVLQFENQKNQELNATCSQLKEMEETFFQTQLFNNSTHTISKSVATLCNIKELVVLPRFTTLCDQPYFFSLMQRISRQSKKPPKIKRIFKATEQGMNSYAFWQNCANKGPTIILCQSKSGHIFGGYTPCNRMIQNRSVYFKDESKTSFLFSYTRGEIYPIYSTQYTIGCKQDQGPQFGSSDFLIKSDFQKGSSLGNDYSIGEHKISNQKTHLMGGEQPDLVEMEVFLIE